MKCEAHPSGDAVGVCRACGRAACPACKVMFAGVLHCKACVESGRAKASSAPTQVLYVPVPPPWTRRAPPPWYAARSARPWMYLLALVPLAGIIIGVAMIGTRHPAAILVGRRCIAVGMAGIIVVCPLLLILSVMW